MNSKWLRMAYAGELLLAVPAVFTLWSQVGGQGHLDLMPWYLKLLLGGAMSLACIFATAALVDAPGWGSTRFYAWVAIIILIGAAMAGVTYYYHLHEEYDDTGDEEPTSATMVLPGIFNA